ncbi:hypothetical protein [Runella salmonicolor]|uniref:Uncharacterized protein n=1 Tax=Runella salmonicolor TaxID=2950278 RepID=A0ABT1FQM5_9BACT|nr:hypothetical protein [Runella salmonicolor]MCP1383083.1 hypothetical protein [Runella salmonicolor]
MDKDLFNILEKINLHESLNLSKIKEINFEEIDSENRVIGLTESLFYNSREVLCFNFYKHITRVIDKYDF